MLYTNGTGNLGVDRQQYSAVSEKERGDVTAMQYSSRNQPGQRPDMRNLDQYARAQYKTDLGASRTTGVSSYRTDAHSLKPTYERSADSKAVVGKSGDSQYTDVMQTSAQNPYSRRPVLGSTRDPVAVNSGMDKRYSAASGYENTQANFDRDRRMDDNLYTNRQTPTGYSSPRERYPPASSFTKYSAAGGYPQEVETARSTQYTSPAEENLRRTLYDKKYQMEAQAAVQKRQADLLGDSRAHLLQRGKEDLERAAGQRIDSARGRYDVGPSTGTQSTDRRMLQDVDNKKLSSAVAVSSSRSEQRKDVAKIGTDSPSVRKPFTKSENGKESGVERGRGYSGLDEKPTARHAMKLKDDYYREDERERELAVSGKRVQNSSSVSTTSSRERFQQQNEKSLPADSRKVQTGLTGSGAKKTKDNRQTIKQESSSLLLKMKEELLRDQAKLDRQLRANAVVSEERTQTADYVNERSSDMYDIGYRRDEYRSSYVTDDRVVCIDTLIIYQVKHRPTCQETKQCIILPPACGRPMQKVENCIVSDNERLILCDAVVVFL